MIVYQLRCGAGHGFEAWFRNSDAYDQQHDAGQVSCPLCGNEEVSKAPMAPRIGRSERGEPYQRRNAETVPTPAAGPEQTVPAQTHPAQVRPDQLKMVMSKIAELNRHIAKTCDYVGTAFAEEARKIHYGETEHRDIYGETSPAEAAELQEEGIAISAVPWIRRTDS